MARQLNIRSEEAIATVERLADRLGLAPADVVVEALRTYDRQVGRGPQAGLRSKMTPTEFAAFRDELDRMIVDANRNRPPGLTSDHSFLYDEYGLPK